MLTPPLLRDLEVAGTRGLADVPLDLPYYFATPYSKYPGGRGSAFLLANRAIAQLTLAGFTCFSPILNNHAADALLPLGDGSFSCYEIHTTRYSHIFPALMILLTDGTTESVGVRQEYQLFAAQQKPVIVWEPSGRNFFRVDGFWDPWTKPEIPEDDVPTNL